MTTTPYPSSSRNSSPCRKETLLCFLVGPTASGKGALARGLAEALGSEILSLDSMKIYRDMDIGTAKPSKESRARIPYHLVDILDPSEYFSVKDYLQQALIAVREILARGKRPLFVGGTALYLKSLVKGIFSGPGADPKLRARLKRMAEKKGRVHLHRVLARVDPPSAASLHPNDMRRVVRALEVYFKEGAPISALQKEFNRNGHIFPHVIVGIQRARADLYERIDLRVERMFELGFFEEARTLCMEKRLGMQASQALGYREIRSFLQGEGSATLPELMDCIKKNTRHFARKQITWLKSFPQIRWIAVDKREELPLLQERVTKAFQMELSKMERI